MKKIVSIGIVALNEEKYLPLLLEDINVQTYPKELIELVLVDSGSKDLTRQIMEQFATDEIGNYHNIQVLSNIKVTQAEGWNVVIKNFQGDVLTRLDAHSRISKTFVEQHLRHINNGERIVGGLCKSLNIDNNNWSKLLLATENSLFGAGINFFRSGHTKRYVKTVAHASYCREVFELVGFFNTFLGRTEDNEIHYRMRRAGYKLLFDPEICSYQYARPSLLKMIKQKYGNGYWIGLTLSVCPACLSIFYFVPFLFVLTICFVVLLASAGYVVPGVLLVSVYVLLSVMMALISVKRNNLKLCSTFLIPFLFFLMHLSYGIGTLVGVCKIPFFRKSFKAMDSSKI